jgi:hypothetical protein
MVDQELFEVELLCVVHIAVFVFVAYHCMMLVGC